jgi:hypothetical protein
MKSPAAPESGLDRRKAVVIFTVPATAGSTGRALARAGFAGPHARFSGRGG